MPQPKKPKQPKSKKITVNVRQRWEGILKSVAKDEVPIEMLESISVNLIDGSKININIQDLLDNGYEPKDIEKHLSEKLNSLDSLIADVDFFISIDAVASTIQPVTDELLKNL